MMPKVFFTNQEDYSKKVYEGQVIVIIDVLSRFEKVELYTGILKNELVYVHHDFIKRVMLYDEVR